MSLNVKYGDVDEDGEDVYSTNPAEQLLDQLGRRQTHRSSPSDWRPQRLGRPGLRYVGSTRGWYLAPSVVEDGEDGHNPTAGRDAEIVYVIHAPEVGRLKIGQTKNLKQRLKALKAFSPVELRLVASFPPESGHSEGSLHRRFGASRLHGEWFSDEILDAILAL